MPSKGYLKHQPIMPTFSKLPEPAFALLVEYKDHPELVFEGGAVEQIADRIQDLELFELTPENDGTLDQIRESARIRLTKTAPKDSANVFGRAFGFWWAMEQGGEEEKP